MKPAGIFSIFSAWTLSLCLFLPLAQQSAAQSLPELAMPSTGSGATTSARFYGGASADNGLSFANSFAFEQTLDIGGEIEVEAAHVGTVGNLYLVLQLGEQLLIRDAGGNYLPWDMSLATLQATSAGKTLSAIESLTIVDDIALGPAGVSDTSLAIFFAYDSAAAPGELFYSGAPLTIAIAAAQPPSEAQSLTLFKETISQPIIQTRCIACHVSLGPASNTRLVYVRSNSSGFQSLNYNTLLDFIQTAANAVDLLLSKPQGTAHGGGVQFNSSSAEFAAWSAFISAAQADL